MDGAIRGVSDALIHRLESAQTRCHVALTRGTVLYIMVQADAEQSGTQMTREAGLSRLSRSSVTQLSHAVGLSSE
ncbi:hypothetical protein NKDENANG_02253 [Candidatus Entotheonellaceae bacterium PAL068K]